MRLSFARSVHFRVTRVAAVLPLAAALLAPLAASAVMMDWVTVGAPGNAADTSPVNCGPSNTSPCGGVPYVYRIGKYEITNAQYAEFLNAVAATDTNGLFLEPPTSSTILRSGTPGSYRYTAGADFQNKPVVRVSFWAAMRFANWLHNGQPTGLQTAATTEDGAYTLTPAAIAANSVLRNAAASVFLPSENEWYKAAYYDPIAGLYYDYPTGTNDETRCVDQLHDTGNSANCWSGQQLSDVGAYRLSVSPSGTYDQGGNASEYNEQIKFNSERGLRGGSWSNDPDSLAADNWSSFATPGVYNEIFGFRVASVPEPSTGPLVLAGLGGLALRRRRRG